MRHDIRTFERGEMIAVIGYSSFISISPEYSRKNSSKLGSSDYSGRIEFGNSLSHKSELARKFDIKFHLCTLTSYVSKITISTCIWSESTKCDSKVADHFGHVRSDKYSGHICFLDSVHGSDTIGKCSEICVIHLVVER